MRCVDIVALLGLHASIAFAQGKAVDSLFYVDQASCKQYINSGQLQNIINEAASMSEAGLQMYNDAGAGTHYGEAYLAGLFGGATINSAAANTIGNVLNSVYNFLGRGMIPTGNVYKPYLFCNDDNFVLQNLDAAAVQLDGSPATTNGENSVSIRNFYARQIAATRSGGNNPNVYLVKYPDQPDQPETYQYYFLAQSGGARVCSPGNYGETFKAQVGGRLAPEGPVAVIVLCPASFSHGNTDTLGDVPAQPADPPTQAVSNLAPYSLTFLHEMMHYGPWNPQVRAIDVEDFFAPGPGGSVIDGCKSHNVPS